MADEPTQTPPSSARPVSRKEAWAAKNKPQPVTLPSGSVADIQLPDLPELLREGNVPNELVPYAIDTEKAISTGDGEVDLEKIIAATDFMRWLISITVKAPELAPEEVVEVVPPLDRDMLLEFALRQRVTDDIGHQLYGQEKVADWRKFRYE